MAELWSHSVHGLKEREKKKKDDGCGYKEKMKARGKRRGSRKEKRHEKKGEGRGWGNKGNWEE